MLGLALEGGGAKGAFHIGAIKALLENGYEFNGVVGTSIGAFNGALICQGDFEKAYELWMNMEPSTLFDIEDEYMRSLARSEITKDTIKYLSGKARSLIGNRGIDTSRLRTVLDSIIDEDKLRDSKIDFGMVTVSIPDFKAVEVYKEDIPYGMIKDYIMASSNFPGFKLHSIDGRYYIDGGIHDNCPVNLLIKKGYRNIIAIRTSNSDKILKLEKEDVNIINIMASEDLGKALIFDNEAINRNIELGYYDTLRVIKNLKGRKYYISMTKDDIFFRIINNIPTDVIFQLGETLKIHPMDSKRMLFEQIIPTIALLLKLPNEATYEDIFIGLLEIIAEKRNINKYKIYSIHEFIEEIEKASPIEVIEARKHRHLNNLKNLANQLLGSHMLDEIGDVVLDTIYYENLKM